MTRRIVRLPSADSATQNEREVVLADEQRSRIASPRHPAGSHPPRHRRQKQRHRADHDR
jgi:hypothetical protein